MDKEHLELGMLRKLTTEEFVSLARNIWGGEGRELATFCAPKALLLLGAGASRATPVNLPVMSEFMEALLGQNGAVNVPGAAQHLAPRWQQIAPAIHKVVTDLEQLLKRSADLEEILCFLQMAKGRDYSGPVFSSTVPVRELKRLVARWKPKAQLAHEIHKLFLYRIIETYAGVKPGAAAQLYAPILRVLADWLRGQRTASERLVLPIITTNYDRCIEGACEVSRNTTVATEANAKLMAMPKIRLVDGFLEERTDGFVEESGEWIWRPAVDYRGDRSVIDRRTGQIVLPHYTTRFLHDSFWNDGPETLYVPYFKIHGSFDWAYTKSVIARLDREYWLWNKEDLPFYHKLRSREWPAPPSFIPYLWEPGNKEWFTNAYQQVGFEFFRASLEKTRVLICAGYSFRDEHLLSALKEAFEVNPTLTFIAITPGESFIPELCEILRGRNFIHLRQSLSDAAPSLRTAMAEISEAGREKPIQSRL